MNASAQVRAEAARAVARVASGQTLDAALGAADLGALTAQNRSLTRALAYGVVRERTLLSHLLHRLLDKPLAKQPEVEALLLAGIHQLRSMRMPAHAAVAETVNAVAPLDAPWARGLVNAVLRRYQRERAALEQALPTDPVVRLSHPEWLVDAIRRDWPRQWKPLLGAGNEPGPLTVRANRRRTTAAEVVQRLPGAGLSGRLVAAAPDAVVLDDAVPVDRLPGFADGAVSVQDAAAQLAADLLELAAGQRVLDACAAPGGKSGHILERADVALTALDVDADRLTQVEQNLARIGLAATVRQGDARESRSWWDGVPFDRILVDAPCSGTGVIRRHPDIKWLRRPTDIPKMARTQSELLHALWGLLAPGGLLVYAVCSVLTAEGDDVVASLLQKAPGARIQPVGGPWGEATAHGRRLPPGGDFDGFYYCCLRRATD